jgi:hypothetical protein
MEAVEVASHAGCLAGRFLKNWLISSHSPLLPKASRNTLQHDIRALYRAIVAVDLVAGEP